METKPGKEEVLDPRIAKLDSMVTLLDRCRPEDIATQVMQCNLHTSIQHEVQGLGSATGAAAAALKQLGTLLWNACIRALGLPGDAPGLWLAQLRGSAADMLLLGWVEDSPHRDLEMLKVLTKTAREWTRAGAYPTAEGAFARAAPYVPRVEALAAAATSEVEVHKARLLVFNFHFHRMELHWLKGDRDAALSLFSQPVTAAVAPLKAERPRLLQFAYANAVALHNDKAWAEALKWLRAADELNRKGDEDPNFKGRIYRMLANCFLETDATESALNCIEIANRIGPSAVGLFLEYKVKLKVGVPDTAKDLLTALASNPECTAKVAIAASSLMVPHDLDAALASLNTVAERLKPQRDDYLLLQQHIFETLAASTARHHLEGALDVLGRLLADGGRSSLPEAVLRALYYGSWNVALRLMGASETARQALVWFQAALSCTPAGDVLDRAKILRAIARVHLSLGEASEGDRSVQEAKAMDPKCLHNHLLGFQIACALGNVGGAGRALEELAAAEGCTATTFAVVASVAHEHSRPALAAMALERFLDRLGPGDVDKLCLVLRNLCLCLEEASKQEPPPETYWAKLQQYASRLRDVLAQCQDQGPLLADDAASLRWWHATAWNAAGSAVHLNRSADAFRLASLAGEFAQHLPASRAQQQLVLDAHLQAAYCATLAIKQPDAGFDRAAALAVVHAGRRLWGTMKGQASAVEEKQPEVRGLVPPDRVLPLLYLAELLVLGDEAPAEIARVIESACDCRDATVADVEAMAGHAALALATNRTALQQVLGRVVRFHAAQAPPDLPALARAYRRLIVACSTREECLPHFDALHALLVALPKSPEEHAGQPGSYPTIELEWLVAEAWNNGVYYFKLNHLARAERWMGNSVKLSRFLPSGFNNNILVQYSRVLDSMHKDKSQAAAAS